MEDYNQEESNEESFAAEIGKAVVISAASVVGMYIGAVAVGSIIQWRNDRKKNQENTNE